MAKWEIVYTRQAQRDARKLAPSGLREKAETLLDILSEDPFKSFPRYEKLIGDLSGAYSRRINIQNRLVYQVLAEMKTVKIIRMWTYYEELEIPVSPYEARGRSCKKCLTKDKGSFIEEGGDMCRPLLCVI